MTYEDYLDKVEAQWNVNVNRLKLSNVGACDKVEAQWNVNAVAGFFGLLCYLDKVEAQWNVNIWFNPVTRPLNGIKQKHSGM